MKISVIQREFTANGYVNKSYKICDCKYCCEGMMHLPNVDFFHMMAENTNSDKEDTGVMIENTKTYHEPYDYDGYGYTESYYYKIDYCPTCGEKIKVEIVDNVDVTKFYNELAEERDKIHQAYNNSDSIIERLEYVKRIQKIDNAINNFYVTDRLPGRNNED